MPESMTCGAKAKKVGASLKSGGHHSLGHSEDMGGTPQSWRNGQRSLHSKREQPIGRCGSVVDQ